MRIVLENIADIDTALAAFLVSLAGPCPNCRGLLLVDGGILKELAAKPSSALVTAWEKLARVKFTGRSPLLVTPALIGLAVVVHNRIFLSSEKSPAVRETAELHDRHLLNLLPLPETDAAILSYDLLLSAYSHFQRETDAGVAADKFRSALLQLTPFTVLKSLDLELPYSLAFRAPEYLPHWPAAGLSEDSPTEVDEWWSRVCDLLARPELVHHLISGWLEMPENRLSCIGLGIFFEELRLRGGYDDHILRFFEAYEFSRRLVKTEAGSGTKTIGLALLNLIETMLSAAGEGSSSRRLNQCGNEYFLKFRALLEIVAARGGVPGGFRHLSHDFCFKQLLPLVSLATITGGRRRDVSSLIDFGQVNFS